MTTRQFEVAATIDNTPEAVVDYIADVRNRPLFLSSLKSVDQIQGEPDAEGTSWSWKWVSLGMEFQGTARCTKKEPGRLYAFESEGGIKSSWTYTASKSNGGTEILLQVQFEVPERVLPHLPTDEVLGRLRRTEAEHAIQNLKTILDR